MGNNVPNRDKGGAREAEESRALQDASMETKELGSEESGRG